MYSQHRFFVEKLTNPPETKVKPLTQVFSPHSTLLYPRRALQAGSFRDISLVERFGAMFTENFPSFFRLWNPESEKKFECGIWNPGLGIRNTTQGIRNRTND